MHIGKRKESFSVPQPSLNWDRKTTEEINFIKPCKGYTSFISSLLKLVAPQHEQLHGKRSSFKFSLFRYQYAGYPRFVFISSICTSMDV